MSSAHRASVVIGFGLVAFAPLALAGCKSERAAAGHQAAGSTTTEPPRSAGSKTAGTPEKTAGTPEMAAGTPEKTAGTPAEPAPGLPLGLPSGTTQLLVGVVDDWDDVTAELVLYQRTDKTWQTVGQPFDAVIGVNGSAWGVGLHGDGPPEGATGPTKREGDGKAPAGAFALTATYGYSQAPLAGARAPYDRVTASWRCVDDGTSAHYNRVLDTASLERDWSSAEVMRRGDELYRWVVFVDHNPRRVAGAGSCIFLHLWRRPPSDRDNASGDGTAGCTAMAQSSMESVLRWLDPAASPVYVLLPRDRAEALRSRLNLP